MPDLATVLVPNAPPPGSGVSKPSVPAGSSGDFADRLAAAEQGQVPRPGSAAGMSQGMPREPSARPIEDPDTAGATTAPPTFPHDPPPPGAAGTIAVAGDTPFWPVPITTNGVTIQPEAPAQESEPQADLAEADATDKRDNLSDRASAGGDSSALNTAPPAEVPILPPIMGPPIVSPTAASVMIDGGAGTTSALVVRAGRQGPPQPRPIAGGVRDTADTFDPRLPAIDGEPPASPAAAVTPTGSDAVTADAHGPLASVSEPPQRDNSDTLADRPAPLPRHALPQDAMPAPRASGVVHPRPGVINELAGGEHPGLRGGDDPAGLVTAHAAGLATPDGAMTLSGIVSGAGDVSASPSTVGTTGRAPVATPADQIAERMAPVLMRLERADGGGQRLTIRLDPGELGQVEVRVERPEALAPRVHILVERPETLALLRQDRAELERALDHAGLGGTGRGIVLDLADPGSIPPVQASADTRHDQPTRQDPAARPFSDNFASMDKQHQPGNPSMAGDGRDRPPRPGSAAMEPFFTEPAGSGPAVAGAWRRFGLNITA